MRLLRKNYFSSENKFLIQKELKFVRRIFLCRRKRCDGVSQFKLESIQRKCFAAYSSWFKGLNFALLV